MDNLFVGDYGTHFIATVRNPDTGAVEDVSSANDIIFTFEKHDKTILAVTGVLNTDGVDGKVLYVILPGEINQSGQWRVQVKVILPVGGWSSSINAFNVNKILV